MAKVKKKEELLSMFKYIKNANKRNKRNRNKT